MSAGKLNFDNKTANWCEQGSTFSQTLTWKDATATPINISGYTARMHIKEKYSDATPIATLNTENGGLTLGGAAGTIAIFLSDTDTAAIPSKDGSAAGTIPPSKEYLYDLELIETSSGRVTRLVEGKFVVAAEATK